MIRKPTENYYSRKHFFLIAGIPGIAKSTLALSAHSPLFIDCDKSLYKVSPIHKTSDYISPESYDEIKTDLSGDLSEYKTLIFDTGGALITMMKSWAISQNPKNAQRDGLTLSMQGYGAIKREFERLIDYCLLTLKKHVVMVCHVKEQLDGDQVTYRIDVEGSSGKYMWKKADLGAFMSVQGQKRILEFSPTESHHAKSAYDICGIIEYPYAKSGNENTFIKDLFARADSYTAKETELLKKYEQLMNQVRELINSVDGPESATDLLKQFTDFKWFYCSKREASALLKAKAKELMLEYHTDKKCFVRVVNECSI